MQESRDISEMPFEQLFQIGEDKYNQMDYEEAEYYYALAYAKKPADDMITMCYAHVLKQNDKPEQAVKILKKSLKENPNGSYKRFFELAQMEEGEKAIKTFEQGIAAALKCLTNPFLTTAPQPQIKRDIALGYASIAEICITDFPDVPFEQVQAKCAEVLEKGKKMDPNCMDVRMQIANCCIEKDQNELAKNELLLVKSNILEQKQEYEDELVTQCAKLLMEVGEYKHSIQVLEKLNETQNNNPETVYLLAYCAYQLGQYSACKDYIAEYPEGQMLDEEVEEAMKELKAELAKKAKKGGDDTEEGNAEEDEWMDVEGSDQDIE